MCAGWRLTNIDSPRSEEKGFQHRGSVRRVTGASGVEVDDNIFVSNVVG